MNRWLLLGAGLGAYALALVATAPATLADAALQRETEGRLRLAEARGSLWSGTGQIEIRDAKGKTGIAEDFSWRVVPGALLKGNLTCEIGLGQDARRFPVTLSWSHIKLENADIRLPAAVLGLGVPRLAPLGLTGAVRIHVTALSIARNALKGNATLQWLAAGSTLTQVSPLGDYELSVEGEGRTARAILRTVQGPLQLDGRGSWAQGAKPAFAGTARVLPQYPQYQAQLAPLLRLIAVERGDGSFELQLK